MKIWAFCVFMPQKLQDMSSFLGFGGNSALLLIIESPIQTNQIYYVFHHTRKNPLKRKNKPYFSRLLKIRKRDFKYKRNVTII